MLQVSLDSQMDSRTQRRRDEGGNKLGEKGDYNSSSFSACDLQLQTQRVAMEYTRYYLVTP